MHPSLTPPRGPGTRFSAIGDLRHAALSRGALAAVFVGAIVVQASQRMNHDVGWLLIASRRLLAGARLYVEGFLDPNPPMILHLLALPVAASRSLGVSELVALRVFVFALAAGAIALCARLAIGLTAEERVASRWWLVLVAFSLLLLDRGDFAQREHLIAIFLVPYLVHASACVRGARVAPADGIASGVLGGLAVALKPQYALVPGLALLGVLAAQRRLPRATVPALAGLVLVVGADLVLLKPDYLRFALPLVLETYGAYQNPLVALLRLSDLLLLLAAFGTPLLLPRESSLGRQGIPKAFAPPASAKS